MSRRREAADLARALLLSTQLQGGDGDADHRRSMSLSPVPGEEEMPSRLDGGGSVEMSKIWALAPTVRELPADIGQEGDSRAGGVMSVHHLLSHSQNGVPLSKDTIETVSDPLSRPIPSPIRSFTNSRSNPSGDASDATPIPPLPSDPFDPHLTEQSGTGSSSSRSRPHLPPTMDIRTFSSPAMPDGTSRRPSVDTSPESSDASRPLFSPTQTSIIRNLIGPAAGPSAVVSAGGASPIRGATVKTYARADRHHSQTAQTPPRLVYSGRSRITLSSSPISEPLDEAVDRGEALAMADEEEEEAIEVVPRSPEHPARTRSTTPRKSSSPARPKSRIEIILPSAASVASTRSEQKQPRKRPSSPDPLDSLSSSKRDAPASDSDTAWHPPSSVPSDPSRRVSKRVNDKQEKEEREKEERRRKRREEKERKLANEAAAAAPTSKPSFSGTEEKQLTPVEPPFVDSVTVEATISAEVESEAGPSRGKGKRKEKKPAKGRKGKQAESMPVDVPLQAEAATEHCGSAGSALVEEAPKAAEAPAEVGEAPPVETGTVASLDEENEEQSDVPVADAVVPSTAAAEGARSPLKAIPVRVNSPATRASPGPRDSTGKPVKPGGIQWKTTRTDLSSLLSKFPGSKPTGMSRRLKIVPLHTKIGPPPKRLPPPPPKPVKRKKGDSDDEDEESEYESDGEGGTRKKVKSNERGMEWFMVED